MPDKKPSFHQAKCKDCGAIIKLSKEVELNEIVQCAECGVEYEVFALQPIQLKSTLMEKDDWGE